METQSGAGALAFAAGARRGDIVPTGWCQLPAPMNAAALARGGLPCVCIDVQHGLHDEASAFASIAAIHHGGAVPGVRIPVGRFDLVSRALDAGARLVIAPMINTLEDARAFVGAAKFPPVGARSWGPSVAMDLLGMDAAGYLENANAMVLTLAMIETAEAVDNLDAILATPGIDGVFVGPSDLSISRSQGARFEPTAGAVLDAAAAIGTRARAAGKIAGVYALDLDKARAFVARGFTLVTIGSDASALRASAAAHVQLAVA